LSLSDALPICSGSSVRLLAQRLGMGPSQRSAHGVLVAALPRRPAPVAPLAPCCLARRPGDRAHHGPRRDRGLAAPGAKAPVLERTAADIARFVPSRRPRSAVRVPRDVPAGAGIRDLARGAVPPGFGG